MTEETLVQRMKLNDKEAFDEIYELYKNEAFRTAYLIAGNYPDSEDIVQETFIKCYLNIRFLKEDGRFRPWFYKILTRTAWRLCQGKRRERPVADIYEKADLTAADRSVDRFIRGEERRELLEQIGELDVKQRTAVILYYFDGLSIAETARVMGCMEGTVKSRLHTARRNLRKALDTMDREMKEAVI